MKKLFFFYFLLQSFVIKAQCYTDINLGSYHTTALRANGTLWGWGYGNYGQLANNIDYNLNPIQISTVNDWRFIANGLYNSFMIKNNGTLWGIGDNYTGILGIGSTALNSTTIIQIGTATNWLKVSANGQATIALKTNGTIWGWGQTDNYELGNNLCCANQLTPIQIGTDTDWVDIEASSQTGSTLAIKNNGTLWGWGSNCVGSLGQGSSTATVNVPTQIGTATNWTKISVSCHVLALKTDNTLWSWGGGVAVKLEMD